MKGPINKGSLVFSIAWIHWNPLDHNLEYSSIHYNVRFIAQALTITNLREKNNHQETIQ